MRDVIQVKLKKGKSSDFEVRYLCEHCSEPISVDDDGFSAVRAMGRTYHTRCLPAAVEEVGPAGVSILVPMASLFDSLVKHYLNPDPAGSPASPPTVEDLVTPYRVTPEEWEGYTEGEPKPQVLEGLVVDLPAPTARRQVETRELLPDGVVLKILEMSRNGTPLKRIREEFPALSERRISRVVRGDYYRAVTGLPAPDPKPRKTLRVPRVVSEAKRAGVAPELPKLNGPGVPRKLEKKDVMEILNLRYVGGKKVFDIAYLFREKIGKTAVQRILRGETYKDITHPYLKELGVPVTMRRRSGAKRTRLSDREVERILDLRWGKGGSYSFIRQELGPRVAKLATDKVLSSILGGKSYEKVVERWRAKHRAASSVSKPVEGKKD